MNQVDVEVGQRIRALRSAQGLTQTDLANLIGVTFQQIQKYESGANRVSASRLLDIAHALRAPVGHFFEGVNGGVAAAGLANGAPAAGDHRLGALLADPEFVGMAHDFARLSPHQRKAVADLVQSIARADEASAASARRQGP